MLRESYDLRVDYLLQRNAALCVALRAVIGTIHRTERGHAATASWTTCPNDLCRKVTRLVGAVEPAKAATRDVA